MRARTAGLHQVAAAADREAEARIVERLKSRAPLLTTPLEESIEPRRCGVADLQRAAVDRRKPACRCSAAGQGQVAGVDRQRAAGPGLDAAEDLRARPVLDDAHVGDVTGQDCRLKT